MIEMTASLVCRCWVLTYRYTCWWYACLAFALGIRDDHFVCRCCLHMYRYTYAYTYRCTHLWMYMGTYPYTYNVLLACIHGGHFSLLPLWLRWQLIWSAGVEYVRTGTCVVGMLTWRPFWPFAFMDKRRQLPLFAGVVYTCTGTCICTHMRI